MIRKNSTRFVEIFARRIPTSATEDAGIGTPVESVHGLFGGLRCIRPILPVIDRIWKGHYHWDLTDQINMVDDINTSRLPNRTRSIASPNDFGAPSIISPNGRFLLTFTRLSYGPEAPIVLGFPRMMNAFLVWEIHSEFEYFRHRPLALTSSSLGLQPDSVMISADGTVAVLGKPMFLANQNFDTEVTVDTDAKTVLVWNQLLGNNPLPDGGVLQESAPDQVILVVNPLAGLSAPQSIVDKCSAGGALAIGDRFLAVAMGGDAVALFNRAASVWQPAQVIHLKALQPHLRVLLFLERCI